MKYATLLLLTTGVIAFEIPFSVPKFFKHKVSASPTQHIQAADDPSPATPRIAIVGAGAGGSSAAFWISKAKSRFGLDIDVDVYDRSDYIGGRQSSKPSSRYTR